MSQFDGAAFEWSKPPRLEDTDGHPFGAGGLPFDFGFTFALDDEGLASLRPLFEGAAFDPDLDEQIANDPCPSCGRKLFGELPPGHAWSLDVSTGEYRCSGPVIPGEVIARREEPR